MAFLGKAPLPAYRISTTDILFIIMLVYFENIGILRADVSLWSAVKCEIAVASTLP